MGRIAGVLLITLLGISGAARIWSSDTPVGGAVAAAATSSSASGGPSQPGANLPAATQKAPYYTCTTNLYVDAVGGNDANTGKTAAAAFKTIGMATWRNPAFGPGTCVNVAPGTYDEFVWLNNPSKTAGSGDGYAVLRATTPLAAKIVGPSSNGYSVVTMQASYAAIDGFDVSGGANGGHCIDGGYNMPNNHAHHLIVLNNHAHDCGGGGVSLAGGDYYTVDGNVTNNTSATNGYQASGISLCCGVMADGSVAPYYRNIIMNNVSYDNVETFACSVIKQPDGCHTDGEGIIVDCFDCNGVGKYTARTLVVGNTVYGNGGNGIQVGRSSNVTVANNTSYNNYTDANNRGTSRSELGNIAGGNNIWVNNIAWAVPGSGIRARNVALLDTGAMTIAGINYPAANNVWTNNVYYGAGVKASGNASISTTTNFNKHPAFTAPVSSDFSLAPGSPALKAGLPQGFLSSTTPNIGAR